MSIKHLGPRTQEEIEVIINKELDKDWREYIYDKVNNELSTIILKINKTKKDEVLLRLVSLSVEMNNIQYLYPTYEKYKKYWERIGFNNDDFNIEFLYKKLLGTSNRNKFNHNKNAPAYKFMHSIHLMMKRCRETEIPNLSIDAWIIGANYYFTVYAFVIRDVNTELYRIFNNGKGYPILPF